MRVLIDVGEKTFWGLRCEGVRDELVIVKNIKKERWSVVHWNGRYGDVKISNIRSEERAKTLYEQFQRAFDQTGARP